MSYCGRTRCPLILTEENVSERNKTIQFLSVHEFLQNTIVWWFTEVYLKYRMSFCCLFGSESPSTIPADKPIRNWGYCILHPTLLELSRMDDRLFQSPWACLMYCCKMKQRYLSLLYLLQFTSSESESEQALSLHPCLFSPSCRC